MKLSETLMINNFELFGLETEVMCIFIKKTAFIIYKFVGLDKYNQVYNDDQMFIPEIQNEDH
jgi:hypothetical protein